MDSQMDRIGMSCPSVHQQAGMSLIEMIVGMAIALLAAVIVVQTFSVNEAFQRSTSGLSDAQQTGNVLSRSLKRMVEQAGSGLVAPIDVSAQDNSGMMWGCGLHAQVAAASGAPTALTPSNTMLPVPFSPISISPLRVAPAVVYPGSSSNSDILVLMAGSPRQTPVDLIARFISPVLELDKSSDPGVGISPGDWLLAYSSESFGSSNVSDCFRVGVDATYVPAPPVSPALSGFGVKRIGEPPRTIPLKLGNGAPPANDDALFLRHLGDNAEPFRFVAITLDERDHTLRMLDLMDPSRTQHIIAENVMAFRVLYGVDIDGNSIMSASEWLPPTGGWAPSVLLDGTRANAKRLGKVLALRVAFVLRSSQLATKESASSSTPLFADLSQAVTITYSGLEANYQHAVFDSTIPLRNIVNLIDRPGAP